MPVATPRCKEAGLWVQIGLGYGVVPAGRAVGLSESTARMLFRKAGGVRPELVEVPKIKLSFAERCRIEAMLVQGLSQAQIARALGRSRSTISREVARHRNVCAGRAGPSGGYHAEVAQVRADERARRPKQPRLQARPGLAARVARYLVQAHSPQQIAGRLRRDFPDHEEMWVSHETIYTSLFRSVFVQTRGGLRRELAQFQRRGRTQRRPRRPPGMRGTKVDGSVGGQGQIPGMVNISARPAEASDRAIPGHWEGDLVMGSKASRSAVATLVERSSRFTILVPLPEGFSAEKVAAAMVPAITALPAHLRRTMAWDRGKEMALHAKIAEATEMAFYFCDPHSPWQRPTNENTNGLLRHYLPKGTDLNQHTPAQLAKFQDELNNRPRKVLDFATPAETLTALLSGPHTQPGAVARTG